MNAIILYGIFETNRKHNFSDLNIGLAQYRVDHPEITDDEAKEIIAFIGHHYDELVKGYAEGPVAFSDAVAACIEADKE